MRCLIHRSALLGRYNPKPAVGGAEGLVRGSDVKFDGKLHHLQKRPSVRKSADSGKSLNQLS